MKATTKKKKTATKPKAALKTKAKAKAKAASTSKTSRAAPRRGDYGKPIEGFFAKHPGELRAILEKLRSLVEASAPDAEASLKWGMPVYTVKGEMMCALGGHKSHVNLILAGTPDTFADPKGRLEGDGKTGRRLVLRTLADLPEKDVRTWLRAAAKRALAKAAG